jgi:hypothetical protein
MMFVNKGKPPKGGRYYVCSAAARNAACDNNRFWRASDVERYLIHQLDPSRLGEVFEPATARSGPSLQEYDSQIAKLTAMKDSAIEAFLRNNGTAFGTDLERRAATLVSEIEEMQKRRDEATAAERSRPHLPTIKSAMETAAMLVAKLDCSTVEQKIAIRTGIIQQLRTAFVEFKFSPHGIAGLIELPEKPKSMKWTFGGHSFPKPISVRVDDDNIERYFYRHAIFYDHPEALYGLDAATGILHPRFDGKV